MDRSVLVGNPCSTIEGALLLPAHPDHSLFAGVRALHLTSNCGPDMKPEPAEQDKDTVQDNWTGWLSWLSDPVPLAANAAVSMSLPVDASAPKIGELVEQALI